MRLELSALLIIDSDLASLTSSNKQAPLGVLKHAVLAPLERRGRERVVPGERVGMVRFAESVVR